MPRTPDIDPFALADMLSAGAWLAKCDPIRSQLFMDELHREAEHTCRNPFQYGYHDRDIRVWQMKRFPFLVYYRVEEEAIRIIAVQHVNKDQDEWMQRLS